MLLTLICITGFCLRIYRLDSESFWIDEASTFNVVTQPDLARVFEQILHEENTPPLFFIIGHYWSKIVPDTEFWMRLLSVIFGSSTLVVFYFTSRVFMPFGSSLITMLMLCFCSYHIHYSQEFRAYSALLFFLTLNTYAYFKLRKEGITPLRQWLFIISGALAVTTHFFSGFYLAAQFLTMILVPPKKPTFTFKKWVHSTGLMLIFSFLSLYLAVYHFVKPIHTTGWSNIATVYTAQNIFLRMMFGVWGLADREKSIIYCIMFIILMGTLCKGFIHGTWKNHSLTLSIKNEFLLMCALLLAFQILFPLSISYVTSLLNDGRRYMLYAMYPLCALLASGIWSYRYALIKLTLIGFFLFGNIQTLEDHYYSIRNPRHREGAAWIKRFLTPGDIILTFDQTRGNIYNCYGLKDIPKFYINRFPPSFQIYSILHAYHANLWVITTNEEIKDPVEAMFGAYYKQTGSFENTTDHGFFLGIYRYKLP